jgi:hypothetical protein
MSGLMKSLVLAITLCVFVPFLAHSLTPGRSPKFGTPVVTKDHILFAGPGSRPHRLICIPRAGGDKVWEIQDSAEALNPFFEMDDQVIITKGTKIFSCSLKDGSTNLLFDTCFKYCWLAPGDSPFVKVRGIKGSREALALVNLREKSQIWEITNLDHVVAESTNFILFRLSDVTNNAGRRLTAISKTTGEVQSHYPVPYPTTPGPSSGVFTGATSGDYFVVDFGYTVHCIEQKSGKTVQEHKMEGFRFPFAPPVARGDSVVVWDHEGANFLSGNVLYSLNVPNLERLEIAIMDGNPMPFEIFGDFLVGKTFPLAHDLKAKRRIWFGGDWNCSGVHDGFIYFSVMDEDGKNTSINKIEVGTGKKTLLYREALPAEMQRKRVAKPS